MIPTTFGTRGQDAVSLYILLDNKRTFIDFAHHARRQFSIVKGLHFIFIFKSARVLVFYALKKITYSEYVVRH
jgi:hypothetical protein